MKIYRCNHCGNIVMMLTDAGVPMQCCGEKMAELKANTVDAATEKHVPFVKKDGNKVTVSVGEVVHPMTEEHYIEWIILEQGSNVQIKYLTPSDKPETTFNLVSDEPFTVYEHCTLHGLWTLESK